jgi:PBP1b-binding outer membrane lipoprotein LpoB
MHNAAMTRRLPLVLIAFLALCLAACASKPGGSATKRDAVLQNYAAAVRWNDFDSAWDFVEPAVRAERPLSDLERERFKQIQVTSYEVRNETLGADGMTFEQTVEIRLVSRNTQVERAMVDHQKWVYDPLVKRWWLVSGLPDIDASR